MEVKEMESQAVDIEVLKIEAMEEYRSYALIASFVDGFASGWKMAVPESFRDALDIKWTPRMINKKKTMFWTQGCSYSFSEGEMIYDTEMAYEQWDVALKHITLGVQIKFATPSQITSETIETNDKTLKITRTRPDKKPKKETVAGMVLKRLRIKQGVVEFKVLRVNKDRSALDEGELLKCNQDEFVSFLQTGIFHTEENKALKTLNLFE